VVAAGGPGVGRRTGQVLARRELSKVMYHPPTPFIERIIQAINRFLAAADHAMPGGWWSLVALAALAVIIVSAVAAWLGPVRRSKRQAAGPLLTGKPRSARGYRENSERLSAVGDYTAAIIERMRAIAAELDERGVLPHLPGRTADELATEAGLARPAAADELMAAARLFDDVRYGERTGTQAGYQRLCELDAEIRTVRAAGTGPPEPAVATGGMS
jgi:hypothetical protein